METGVFLFNSKSKPKILPVFRMKATSTLLFPTWKTIKKARGRLI